MDASIDPASSLVKTLPPCNYIRSTHNPSECIPNQNQAHTHTRLLMRSHSHPLLHSHTCHHTELQRRACVCMFPDTPYVFPRTSTCPEQLSDRLVIRWSPLPRNSISLFSPELWAELPQNEIHTQDPLSGEDSNPFQLHWKSRCSSMEAWPASHCHNRPLPRLICSLSAFWLKFQSGICG